MTLASTCEFAEQENGFIRNRIVLGIKDSGLQDRLLRENNLSLEKAIGIARAAEASREQIRNMKYESATVNSVKENQNKPQNQTILDRVLGARAAGVHYRLFSVWTLVPVRRDQQLSDHSTVDEIASGAADCRLTYTMANCPQRRLRKGDLLEVARELGVEVNGDQTKVEIKDMILQNDKNDMETTKAVMEGILEEKER
ncbi:uncharacterized protein TNCV_3104641 [Trichonephila clavipes]|nr:uncharacterized protein TNCV_3104641 [Trichonephila clavipes]